MTNYEISVDQGLNMEVLIKFILAQDITFSPPLSSKVNINEFVQKIMASAIIVKAVLNNEIIGIASFYTNDFISFEGHLTLLTVDEKYRNMGIASALIDKMFEILKEKGMISVDLTTELENENARKLYEKMGFEIIRIFDNRVKYKCILN